MLCYQSSRNATDLIHDTFAWITSNGRAIRLLLAILVPCSIFVQSFADLSGWLNNEQMDSFEAFFHYLFPGFTDNSEYVSQTSSMVLYAHYLLLIIVCIIFIPLLRHYFSAHKSLKRLTFSRLFTIIKQNLAITLISTVLILGTYFILMMTNMITILSVFVVYFVVFPISSSIMLGRELSMFGWKHRIWFNIKYLFLITLIVVLIQLLPMYTMGLFTFIFSILKVSLESLLPSYDIIEEIILFVIGALSYLTFSLSIVVLLTSLVLFHGTITDPIDFTE